MNTLQMQYFLLVAEKNSLSTAAKELLLTTSALSKTISRLEDELGVSLFLRDNNGMKLTPAGKEVQKTFYKVLNQLDDLKLTLDNDNMRKQYRLDIVSTMSYSGTDMLSAFIHAHPEIFVAYSEIVADDFSEDSLIDKYDFLLSSTGSATGAEIVCTPLCSHTPYAAVSVQSSLAKRSCVSFQELSQLPFINSPSKTKWSKYVQNLFRVNGLELHPIMECPQTIRIKAVAANLGVTIASAMLAKVSSSIPGVVFLPLEGVIPPNEVCLFYDVNHAQSKAFQLFLSFAEAFYKDDKNEPFIQ